MNDPNFYLEGVIRDKDELQNFEGPLNLILMLLAKNKIEIRDIKISDILDQYLDYLNRMEEMDLEIASEFVQMASHLLYIKARTLLNTDEEVSELEVLIETLEQMKGKELFASLSQVLPDVKSMSEKGILLLTKEPGPFPSDDSAVQYTFSSIDLMRGVYRAFSQAKVSLEPEAVVASVPRKIRYSVKEKSREILNLLRRDSMTLPALYRGCESRSEIVATFVSVLELCSSGIIGLTIQDNEYLLSYSGGDIESAIENISE